MLRLRLRLLLLRLQLTLRLQNLRKWRRLLRLQLWIVVLLRRGRLMLQLLLFKRIMRIVIVLR